jgi:hypothetical protein
VLSVGRLPLPFQLGLPQVIHSDVDADVDGGADDEEQKPNVNKLGVET